MMLRARLLRWLHLFGWALRPWRRSLGCRGVTYFDRQRTVRVSCRCGRVFGEATDPRAKLVIIAIDACMAAFAASARQERNARTTRGS
jgi:hypothetical protein